MSENVPTGLDGRRLPEAAQRALRERAIAAYNLNFRVAMTLDCPGGLFSS